MFLIVFWFVHVMEVERRRWITCEVEDGGVGSWRGQKGGVGMGGGECRWGEHGGEHWKRREVGMGIAIVEGWTRDISVGRAMDWSRGTRVDGVRARVEGRAWMRCWTYVEARAWMG